MLSAMSSKVILVVGGPGTGKTSLITRFAEGSVPVEPERTIGLNTLITAVIKHEGQDLPDELAALVPPDGMSLNFWEIGGRETYRALPRDKKVDALVICYDVTDRASFAKVAHLLLQYRVDRHLIHERPVVVSSRETAPRLATIVCGLMTDCGASAVTAEEVQHMKEANGIQHFTASAATGEGVFQAFHALLTEVLEAEEEAAAELEAFQLETPVKDRWGLSGKGNHPEEPSVMMTCPRGERPHEPRGDVPDRLVEVYDANGIVFSARPLKVCLENGLFHRAVHVWLFDIKTGGLLMRKNHGTAEKHPNLWGPSCHTEVECYERSQKVGGHASELSTHAASRALEAQVGLVIEPSKLEHWFSCSSRDGTCCEHLDVYVISMEADHLVLSLAPGEEVEWVHFTDAFGDVAASQQGSILYVEDEYRHAMCHRIRARIVHADDHGLFDDAVLHARPQAGNQYPVVGLSQGSIPIRAAAR